MAKDRYVAVLTPEGASLIRRRGRAELDLKLDEAAAGGAGDAGAAVEALGRLLGRPEVDGGRLAILLSSHFVHFQLLPWRDEIGTVDELLAYAQFSFEQVYGAVASSWTVMVAPDAPGRPRLAAAVPTATLEGISTLSAGVSSRLVIDSIQPYLTAAFNRYCQPASGDDFLFVLAEPARTCLLAAAAGHWQSVRVGAWDGQEASLKAQIERELHLSSAGAGDAFRVFVHAPRPEGIVLAGIEASVLGPDLPPGLVETADARLTMAMAIL